VEKIPVSDLCPGDVFKTCFTGATGRPLAFHSFGSVTAELTYPNGTIIIKDIHPDALVTVPYFTRRS
jgi:hypothetical protein